MTKSEDANEMLHCLLRQIDLQRMKYEPRQCDILTSVDSNEPVQPPLNLRNSNFFIFFLSPNKLFFYLNTLFSPSSDIQRVGEGHPSACLTNYSKGILLVDCISSSPLSCTFHAISKAVLKQFKQP